MGGGGILTAFAGLLLVPFELWAVSRINWQRLTPAEKNLRLATHPPALVAGALITAKGAGVHDIGGMLMHLVEQSSDGPARWIAGTLCASLIGFWLICLWQCIGIRDRNLTARALLKFIGGAVVTVYLWRLYPWLQLAPSLPGFFAVAAVFLISVFCLITGAIRFLLLVVPMRSARIIVDKDIAAQKFDWNR
jgi:hypothetical protein